MIRAGTFLALAGLVALLLANGHASFVIAATPVSIPATPAVSVLGETPGSVPLSLLVQNAGGDGDRLLGGSTPLARAVVVHRSRLDHGVRAMELAADGIPIAGGATVMFEPERDHLMLIGLRESLVQGQTFPITLQFARAGEVTVTARVRRRVDAAGVAPIPSVVAGDLIISLVSAPPAAAVIAATPRAAR